MGLCSENNEYAHNTGAKLAETGVWVQVGLVEQCAFSSARILDVKTHNQFLCVFWHVFP